MKSKVEIHVVIGSVICLLMMVVFFAFSAKLPYNVPTHWDTHGNVNGSLPKPWLVFGLPIAYLIVNLISGVSLVGKEENRLWRFYIVPALAIIVTGIVIYLGLK